MKSLYNPKVMAVALVTALAPVIIAFSAFVANEAQILFDMHLDGVALAGYISTFLIAVAIIGIRALEHLGGKLIRDVLRLVPTAVAAAAAVKPPVQAPPAPAPPAPAPPTRPAPPVVPEPPERGGVAPELEHWPTSPVAEPPATPEPLKGPGQ